MRRSLLEALGHPSVARGPVFESVEVATASSPSRYGLDGSADADIAAVELEHMMWVQERLDEDPEHVLARARDLWDADLDEATLRAALDKARAVLASEGVAESMLESVTRFRTGLGLPDGFHIEDQDPQIPVHPYDDRFETLADGLQYAYAFVAASTRGVLQPKAPFRYHRAGRSFVYELPATATNLALLADFGNGLAHSRYIAKHIRKLAPAHLLYLGDVYYAGTSTEFSTIVAPELDDMLATTNVMMLNSNHEMFSKGYPYFSYLDYRRAKGAPQLQEGSYFCLRFGDQFQVIAVDTDYFGTGKLENPTQRAWLGEVLRWGREHGAINILLTAGEPYSYGSNKTTRLATHLKPYLQLVDLWFWGNTHYCGLFDRTAEFPVASCIGHGGYPYRLREYSLDENAYGEPCPALPLFLETRSRYHGTDVRPELGNNGFCTMRLEPAATREQRRVQLEYIDWRKQPRYRGELGVRDGKLSLLEGGEVV